ncbi:hypothetical protein PAESOLCIP111_02758 [Paenibacillus solanacearum]|uniref:CAAX prenyl protease 2/Lysostaphin resistance protein A-like domain-containing protein n=1 Tax=Paenibacillus solanacearum TaxID=2048548 RepID=A0A916K4W4_9BACL|nr:type II CAAX endopeptidase family protein [Paenibacillus solanacearum]CAG7625742.1 hypothetical protein PAESOLCIP111_02758 [Paenibacillus solanacearum]
MDKRYVFILLVFALITIPGSLLLYENKYTITFLPLVCLVIVSMLLKDEILHFDFNLLKNRELYIWVYKGLAYCIYTYAIGVLVFGTVHTIAEEASYSFPIVPIYIVITGPIIEEVVFRKIIFGRLSAKFGFWPAALCSSILYSIIHYSIERFVIYIVVGLFLCYIYKRSNTIVSTIMIHAILNIAALISATLLQ